MTRDELREIVEGISDEALKKILDINSHDIGRAKEKANEAGTQLEESNTRIRGLEEELEFLRKSQCEAEEMKLKIDELQKVIDDRHAEDERNARITSMEDRFHRVLGEKEFLNDYTRKGVFESFSKALEEERNLGREDKDVFEEIVGATDNLFRTEKTMPRVVASTMGSQDELSHGDVREIMGLPTE